MPLLEINDLYVSYRTGRQRLSVVNGVTLDMAAGESVGLVGESGCGKTTLANAVLRIVPASGGGINFDGVAATRLRGRALRRFRRRVQMVFQDPYGSLNPRMTVGTALEEVLAVHGLGPAAARRERVVELLGRVGMDPEYAGRYPHELSGGQRQRVGIARALTPGPRLILADEPVSALDVSVQAQILALMRKLQKEDGLAWLLIAHDLAVVNYLCSRVYVMYLGRIVESGPCGEVFRQPLHPYTEALAAAVPDLDTALTGGRRHRPLPGEPPSPGLLIPGCPFHPRCVYARDICRQTVPPQIEIGARRFCRCHLARERAGLEERAK